MVNYDNMNKIKHPGTTRLFMHHEASPTEIHWYWVFLQYSGDR